MQIESGLNGTALPHIKACIKYQVRTITTGTLYLKVRGRECKTSAEMQAIHESTHQWCDRDTHQEG